MARESSESATLPPSTQYHYGPLSDSPPTHIDTVLTSMTYTEEFLNNCPCALPLCLGSIGTIMKGLGLEEYLQAAY